MKGIYLRYQVWNSRGELVMKDKVFEAETVEQVEAQMHKWLQKAEKQPNWQGVYSTATS